MQVINNITSLTSGFGQLRLYNDLFANESSLLANKPCFIDVSINDNARLLTEVKRVRLVYACKGVMVSWLNPLGGFDYWLFDGYQKSEVQSDNEILQNSALKNPQTYETEFTTGYDKFSKKKPAGHIITLTASKVNKEYADGIQYLVSSPAVYIVGNDYPNGAKRVVIETTSFVYIDDAQKLLDISITYKDNDILIQRL